MLARYGPTTLDERAPVAEEVATRAGNIPLALIAGTLPSSPCTCRATRLHLVVPRSEMTTLGRNTPGGVAFLGPSPGTAGCVRVGRG